MQLFKQGAVEQEEQEENEEQQEENEEEQEESEEEQDQEQEENEEEELSARENTPQEKKPLTLTEIGSLMSVFRH